MAQCVGRTYQGLEMLYHDPKVMGLNPGRVELGVCCPSV